MQQRKDSGRAHRAKDPTGEEGIGGKMNDLKVQRERRESCVGDGERWDLRIAIDEGKTKERILPT